MDATTRRKWVGQSVGRLEDPRLITGRGGYIDDIRLPRMLHAAVVHSPFPHARVGRIDAEAARSVRGVVAVVTGPESLALIGTLPPGPMGSRTPYPAICTDKVRHIGEIVAAVAATDRYIAEDAAALIEVDYEPLDAVTDIASAIAPGAPLVQEAMGSNVVYDREWTFGDVEADFAGADRVVHDHLRWRRSSAQPIETPGAIVDFNPVSQEMTIWTNEKAWPQRQFELAELFKVASNKLHLVPVPAGGSFGSKDEMFKVVAIAGMLAKVVGRPVKYLEDRVENLLNADCDGPDREYEVELAVMNDGTIRSMRVFVADDYGAYFQRGTGHHGNLFAQLQGPYRITSCGYHLRCVLTNKNQQGAFRGFGAGEANWMLERMVDLAARELSMDPVEIRRRNFIGKDEFPFKSLTGNIYDSGDYEGVLDKALELSHYAEWREKQKQLRAEGRHIGVGIASCQLRSVFSPSENWIMNDDYMEKMKTGPSSSPESITLSVDVLGRLTATLYSYAFWGNSPETVVAQMVADEFDIKPDEVSVVYASPMGAMPGVGPGGSRLTVMLAGAVVGAAKKVREKALRVGAQMLGVGADEVEWADGAIRCIADHFRIKTLAEVSRTVRLHTHSLSTPPPGAPDREGFESGLEASFTYDHPYNRLPKPDRSDLGVFYPIMAHTCHIAVVEVDPETGGVSFLGYYAVQDSGTVVNPKSLEGMVIGGSVQGIGTALTEECVYTDDGQLLSASFQDYLLPTAMEAPPEIKVAFHETPSPFTAYGVKGGGESGRMAAPAVVPAAIEDALSPWGVRVREIPATPMRIRALIDAASGGPA
jgi:CO/xanthine dehydrogenase Mo-binding subunit